jgi:hypothetical protein
MNPYQMFQTDKKAETEQGITLDYGSFKFRIVRAGGANRKYTETLNRRLKPYRRQLDNDTMDPDIALRTMAEVYADTVFLGWEDVTGPDGQPLDYCRNNVIKLLTDLPDLFRDLQAQANQAATFRAVEREEEAKNSGSGFAGLFPTVES